MPERIKSRLRQYRFYQILQRQYAKWRKRRAEAKARRSYRQKIRTWRKKHPNGVFLVLTPEHGNLGDHAIAKSEIAILDGQRIPYFEITGRQLWDLDRLKILSLMNGVPILVNGGGNLGTLWFNVETVFRHIICENPKSPIACLPNTIYYENSAWGKEELEKSKKIYNAHPDLTLYARERLSYDYMKPLYRNVELVPDMVLALNECQDALPRSGCLLCLRKDIEKTRTEAEEAVLLTAMRELFGERIAYADTVLDHPIAVKDRERELREMFDRFKHAELVITDRLHGMIFAAITGTPCIVINSKSPKVRGCYEWIKDLPYVRFCDDVHKIVEEYRQIPQGVHTYDNSKLLPYYEKLERQIAKLAKRG